VEAPAVAEDLASRAIRGWAAIENALYRDVQRVCSGGTLPLILRFQRAYVPTRNAAPVYLYVDNRIDVMPSPGV
jgi:hypothetical protein